MMKWIILVFMIFSKTILLGQCMGKRWIQIIDEHNQEPLAKATVKLKHQQFITNQLGYIEVNHVCEDGTKISFSHIGCATAEKIIFPGKDTLTLFLEHHILELPGSNIETQSNQLQNDVVIHPLSSQWGYLKSISQSLSQVPGLQIQKSGANVEKPNIQGLSGSRVVYFQNQIRMETQSWGSDHAPEIDPQSQSEIIVTTGGRTLLYCSDAIGGLIQTNNLLPQKNATAFLGLQSQGKGGKMGLIIPGQFKDGGLFSISTTATILGDYQTPSYILSNTGKREFNVQVNYHKKIAFHQGRISGQLSLFQNQLGVLSWSHFGNLTDLNKILQPGWVPPDSTFRYQIAKPYQTSQHQWIVFRFDFSKHHWSFSRQFNYRSEFDKHIPLGGSTSLPGMQLGLASNSVVHEFKSLNHIKCINQLDWNVQSYAGSYFVPNDQLLHLGSGWEWTKDHQYGSWFLNARFDQWQYWDISNASRKLENKSYRGIAYSMSHALKWGNTGQLWLSIGKQYRPPQMSELFSDGLHHGSASIEKGNPFLHPEKSYFIDSKCSYSINKWTIQGSFYAKKINGFINLEPTGENQITLRGVFPVFQYVQRDVYSWGGDIQIDKKHFLVDQLQCTLKGNVIHLGMIHQLENLYGIPPASIQGQWKYNWKNKRINWTAQATIQEVFHPFWAPISTDLLPPPNSYILIHAGIQIRYKSTTCLLSAENILNQSYFDYMDRMRYFAMSPGRNITVQIKKQF